MTENQREQIVNRINYGMTIAHSQQSEDRVHRRREPSVQNDNLLCACTGLACEGVCRETHLHRPRYANPMAKKDTDVKKSWAEKCPEAYKN